MKTNYLDSIKKQFEYYKMLGEKTFNQLNDADLFWQYNSESNSVAIIVNHLEDVRNFKELKINSLWFPKRVRD